MLIYVSANRLVDFCVLGFLLNPAGLSCRCEGRASASFVRQCDFVPAYPPRARCVLSDKMRPAFFSDPLRPSGGLRNTILARETLALSRCIPLACGGNRHRALSRHPTVSPACPLARRLRSPCTHRSGGYRAPLNPLASVWPLHHQSGERSCCPRYPHVHSWRPTVRRLDARFLPVAMHPGSLSWAAQLAAVPANAISARHFQHIRLHCLPPPSVLRKAHRRSAVDVPRQDR